MNVIEKISMKDLLDFYAKEESESTYYSTIDDGLWREHKDRVKVIRAEIDRRLARKDEAIADLLGKLASIEHIAAHSADSPEVYERWSGGRSYKDAIGAVIDIARKAMEEHE